MGSIRGFWLILHTPIIAEKDPDDKYSPSGENTCYILAVNFNLRHFLNTLNRKKYNDKNSYASKFKETPL